MITGIYKIENRITGKIYIGQSVNIKKRWTQHRRNAYVLPLNNKQYYCRLYKAIREYDINNFDFSIIEECSRELLNEREIYWINYYNSYYDGYNMTPGGSVINQAHLRKVSCYDLEGNFIKEYPSITAAALECNGSYDAIYSAINRKQSAYGYQWSYLKTNKIGVYVGSKMPIIAFSTETGKKEKIFSSINETIKETKDGFYTIKKSCNTHHFSGRYQYRYWIENSKLSQILPYKYTQEIAVDQYDLDGNYISSYNSITEASKKIGLEASNISTCLNQRQKSCGNFLWCKHGDIPPTKYEDKRVNHTTSSIKRKVSQYDLNHVLIKTYNSAHEAAREIGKPKSANHITECCQNKRKTCEKFIWEYTKDEE